MGVLPVDVISALSDDLHMATGYSYQELKDLPALPPDCSHRLASAMSLAKSFTKKFLPNETSQQDLACLTKFEEVNKASSLWELRLNTSGDEELWGTFKNELYKFFNPGGLPLVDSLDQLFLNGRVGPGSSIGSPNGDFYTKFFASELTSSSPVLIEHYKHNVRRFAEWGNAETIRRLHYSVPRIVQGSRLSFVPKSDTISRSICTEPSLNMYYQLGLCQYLTERLKSYFRIDLSRQPVENAELARIGSLDGSWSTIDLESASDTLSVALCREVLPPDVFSLLMLLRCNSLTYKGTCYSLHMISTMGNGFTFPLQTIIFSAMVRAAYILHQSQDKVCVFGDDIVVRDYAYLRVCRLLELAGCRVNSSKSFHKGPFRESCGADYFLGRNIRGVYMKRFDTLQDSYAVINALNGFSARTGLTLNTVMKCLIRKVDRSLEIPLWENPSSGIRMPFSMVRTRRMSKTTYGVVYSKYSFKARRIRIVEGGMWLKGRYIAYNCSGLLIALLSGMALSSGLPLREEGRWKKERRSCSNWDSFDSTSGILSGVDIKQLETATYFNLFV